MKNYARLITAAVVIMVTACSSSRFNYVVDPTPLVQGKTLYSIKNVNVSITTFGIKITKSNDVKGYMSENDMAKVFQEKITGYMKENNIYDSGKSPEYTLSLEIRYTRTFAVNSNKVISPSFSYSWVVEKEGKQIASYQSRGMEFTGLKRFGEVLNTGSSDINPEAELEYIDSISKYIVEEDIVNLGK